MPFRQDHLPHTRSTNQCRARKRVREIKRTTNLDINTSNNSTLAVAIHQALATPGVAIPPTLAATGKDKVAIGFLTKSKDADLVVASERIAEIRSGIAGMK